MKKIVTLSLLSLSVMTSFAQSSPKKAPYSKLNKQAISYFLAHQTQAAASKSTTIKERVKAESDYDNTVTPAAIQDSALFVYSNGRGSTFDLNFLTYNYYNPYSQGSTLFDFSGHGIPTQQVFFDTAYSWAPDPNSNIFSFYETASQSINISGAITSYNDRYGDSSTNANTDQTIKYDGSGKMIAVYYYNSKLGVDDSTYKRFFSYDASGNLMIDSTYQYNGSGWELNEKVVYTRDAAGNILQLNDYSYTGSATGWSLQDQYFCTYDASNRLATIRITYNVPTFGGVVTVARDTFTYSGSYSFFSTFKDYEAVTDTVLQPYQYVTKHMNAAGLPDTFVKYQWGASSWVPAEKDVLYYNSYNDPVQILGYAYASGTYSTAPTISGYWYYENYFPSGVTEASSKTDNTKLYPNPTTGTLNISGLEVPENSLITINIINTNGQILSTSSVHYNGQTKQVYVADLAPGTYWVIISGDNGATLHKQSFVKL